MAEHVYITTQQLRNLKNVSGGDHKNNDAESHEQVLADAQDFVPEFGKTTRVIRVATKSTKRVNQKDLTKLRQEYKQAIRADKEQKTINDILERGRKTNGSSGQLERSGWDDNVKDLLRCLPQINGDINRDAYLGDVSRLDLGEYEIKESTARGAESVLYKAVQGGSVFCVKAIRNWKDILLGDPLTRSQKPLLQDVSYRTKCRHLKNEFKISRKLHEGISIDNSAVEIFALRQRKVWGVEIGYDLILEFVNGYNLAYRNLVQNMTFNDKIRACYWMAVSLEGIHSHDIVHLDIKPSNFMLDSSGRIRIIDFGVSVPNGTVCRAVTGTVGYLSPEQICRATVDAQTDVFALGVVFAVMFGGKMLQQTVEECGKRRVKSDAKLSLEGNDEPMVGDIPELAEYPELADVIRRCTIPNRRTRTRTCRQILVEFRQFAENHGIVLDW